MLLASVPEITGLVSELIGLDFSGGKMKAVLLQQPCPFLTLHLSKESSRFPFDIYRSLTKAARERTTQWS